MSAIYFKGNIMPHTISLVSQFEDIIRRGGNNLENNVTNFVRPVWRQKSPTSIKNVKECDNGSEKSESPPPIPKRLPIHTECTINNIPPGKYIHHLHNRMLAYENQTFDSQDVENSVFIISYHDQVYLINT